ncbi:phage tail assembly protein, partial [Shigella flexneri]|nr:phage tail assembly protein [Shigella flexneri]
GKHLRKRLYNVAWFWKLNPLELRRVAVSQFTELEAEAVRINEEMKHG